MKIFSMTDVGRKREMNQDYVFATDESLGTLPNLLVVADGMGGHKAGDFASKYTVEVLKEELKHTLKDGPEEILKDAAQTANHKLIEKADEDINLEGMGTTLVAATVIDHTLYFINVDDVFRECRRQPFVFDQSGHSAAYERSFPGRRDGSSGRNQ